MLDNLNDHYTLVNYLLTWKAYIIYFEESPFKADDILNINLITPFNYEGYYTPHTIISSYTLRIPSVEKLLDLLNNVDDYVEVSIQFILKDGRCRYLTMCSHPQGWDVVELDEFIDDLQKTINSSE